MKGKPSRPVPQNSVWSSPVFLTFLHRVDWHRLAYWPWPLVENHWFKPLTCFCNSPAFPWFLSFNSNNLYWIFIRRLYIHFRLFIWISGEGGSFLRLLCHLWILVTVHNFAVCLWGHERWWHYTYWSPSSSGRGDMQCLGVISRAEPMSGLCDRTFSSFPGHLRRTLRTH